MGKIRNIVFDNGGVISIADMENARRIFLDLGVSNIDDFINITTQKGIFGDLEAGRLTGEEFCEALSKEAGKPISLEEGARGMRGFVPSVPPRNLEKVRALKEEGYRIYMLSNTNPFVGAFMRSESYDGHGHSLEWYMDKLYLSYEMKVMKPDERIFRMMVADSGMVPEETLFVDDSPVNIRTAEQIGFRTFCPANGSDWTIEIDECLR